MTCLRSQLSSHPLILCSQALLDPCAHTSFHPIVPSSNHLSAVNSNSASILSFSLMTNMAAQEPGLAAQGPSQANQVGDPQPPPSFPTTLSFYPSLSNQSANISLQTIWSSTIQTYLVRINFIINLVTGFPCASNSHSHISIKGLRKKEHALPARHLPTFDLLCLCIHSLRSGYMSPTVDLM